MARPKTGRKQIALRLDAETIGTLDIMAEERGLSLGRVAEELVLKGIMQAPMYQSLDCLRDEVRVLREVIVRGL